MAESDKPELADDFRIESIDFVPAEARHAGRLRRLEKLFLHWQRPEQRRLRRWTGISLLSCLLLILVVALLNPSVGLSSLFASHSLLQVAPQSSIARQSTSFSSLTSHASSAILCPTQAAWSPDSSTVAVLGYTQACTQKTYIPAQVDLFSAATTREVGYWQPNQAILETLEHSPYISPAMFADLAHKPIPGEAFGSSPAPSIDYQQIIWSPDSSHLALSFFVITRPLAYQGIFLARRDGGSAEVLLKPVAGPSTTLLWDLHTRQAVFPAAFTPALTYAWDQHDQLSPVVPLTLNSHFSAYTENAVGNPDGEHSFTIWQPGHLTPLPAKHLPPAYVWSTNFVIWSPDGRYLITNFSFTGLVVPPDAHLANGGTGPLANPQALRIPAHDPATLISAAANAQAVAWNPAGSMLAVYTATGTVDLYTCLTGRLLRSLKLSSSHVLAGLAVLLSWSPDGQTVLLSSARWGLTTLWHVSQD